MKNTDSTVLSKRFKTTILSILLTSLFCLAGCESPFSNNDPVNLTLSSNVSSFTPSIPVEMEADIEDYRYVFDAYINALNAADSIFYDRSFLTSVSDGTGLLQTDTTIQEFHDQYVIITAESGQISWSIVTGEGVVLANPQTNEYTRGGSPDTHQQDHLLWLAQQNLTLLSVNIESLNNIDTLCFSVLEPNGMANWYFDQSGALLLRTYFTEENSISVWYNNFIFNSIGLDYYDISGFRYVEQLSFEPPELSSSEESSESVSSIVESSETSSTKTESSSSSQTTSQSVTSSSAVSSQPNSMVETPQSSATSSSKPTVAFPEEPSQNTSSSSAQPSESEELALAYIQSTLPFPNGVTVTSQDSDYRNNQKIVTANGTLTVNAPIVTSYYSARLSGTLGYTEKEFFDNEQGYTYTTITGNLNGWFITVSIAESHVTSKGTMSIRMER